ncbi:MAG: hypothetical protein HZC49_00960 [Nitrospirae bacterium]|nr:hypothetical protein [Nitrospirota bacterium]
MTTVINFNILNFFRLKQNNYTVNDVRINNNFSGRNKNESQDNDRIIDVTPLNRKFAAGGDLIPRTVPVPEKNAPYPLLAMGQTAVINTYDRSGNVIRMNHSKGTHIDSYV